MKNYFNKRYSPPLILALSIGLPLLFWAAGTQHDTVFGRGANIFFSLAIILFINGFIKEIARIDIPDKKKINKHPLNILVKYYIYFIAVYFVFNVLQTYKINVGIPFGHGGDFFHILDLAYGNNYSEISQIGYLPGLLSITKIMSIFFMKKDGLIDRNFYGWALYLVIFSISLYIVCRPLIKTTFANIRLPIFLVFFTSYPFLLELERGNFVIISMVFLALSIQLYDGVWSSSFVGLFSTLKILNIAFLPSFLFSRKVKLRFLVSAILICGLIFPLILFYLTGSQVNYDGLFGRVISTGSFQDAHVAVAHSGAYAALTFLQNSGIFPYADRQNFLYKSTILLLTLLLLYYFMEIYFFILKKKIFQKKDLCFSLIGVFILTKFFYQNNTDMNLILLFPIIVQLFLEKLSYVEKLIFALLLLLLFPFYIVIFFNIEELNSFFYYSSRTLIYTFIYLNIIILSFLRFSDISKRVQLINGG